VLGLIRQRAFDSAENLGIYGRGRVFAGWTWADGEKGRGTGEVGFNSTILESRIVRNDEHKRKDPSVGKKETKL